ncbi:SDR family NAD(P)-dependent oxidoreductase [Chloracidobacterium aggregatum]|uniref:SDR family NAD(P)-dependent oxidoreductase n=1 Tax=Chloracidobacterium aggregatum TaxID=2851959 RepID=UPI001FE9ED90|nr:SDR family NAD(P)-dependent oxidoreductase [Chloracidobacterium aggregatum]
MASETMRLNGKVALITGAAGGIGGVVTRMYLREGARVAISSRSLERAGQFRTALIAEGFSGDDILPVAFAPTDLAGMQAALEAIAARWGGLDVLINNAGSAGAKQPLFRIPFTLEDLAQLAAEGFTETETMRESAANLLGLPWHLTRLALPYLRVGASIINVSTIFSRTNYYGRIPYVVPKSALNALSLGLAKQLGTTDRAVRVNTVFPGPIDSDRIRTVFGAMDRLKGVPEGTTAQEFFDIMILARTRGGEVPTKCYPTQADVAHVMLFLGSDESAAISGHNFEITHGMQVKAQSRTKLTAWPDQRLIDLNRRVVLIVGGEQVHDAVTIAASQQSYGASVILTFRQPEAVNTAKAQLESCGLNHSIAVTWLDPLRRESVTSVFDLIRERYHRLDTVIVFPAHAAGYYGPELIPDEPERIRQFTDEAILGTTAFAAQLSRFLLDFDAENELQEPVNVLFLTNEHDGATNAFEDIYRAAVEQLLRVWRHEDELQVAAGTRRFAVRTNQIVRYANAEPDNLKFTADWLATLANRVRIFDELNLYVPENIQRTTGKAELPRDIARTLLGLHIGKVAVITGGSAGIGGAIGHYLALSGAKVVLAARDAERLAALKREIVAELFAIGYPQPETRVEILPDIDVADEEALGRLVKFAMDKFGRIDFLINNAGIAGAEEMVVDLPLAAWRHTLKANLLSNYSLIYKIAPLMKKQGAGYILNVSSYFGGEKYVAVAYPNRSDYAVSKAGQRALAEILARHLGPEIQINALSPGPVEGKRLRGEGSRPGLYARRARLILENKRLNDIHDAVIRAWREGETVRATLGMLAHNHFDDVLAAGPPEPVRRLITHLRASAVNEGHSDSHYLMTRKIAEKLLHRLFEGGYMTSVEDREAFTLAFLSELPEPPEPFFDPAEVEKEAVRVQSSVLTMLNLGRMPTEEEIAIATVFYLSDPNVSGETLHPSGGLKFDRTVTEGEFYGLPRNEDLMELRRKNVLLIGDCLEEELRWLVGAFAIQLVVRNCIILTRTAERADSLRHYFSAQRLNNLHVFSGGANVEAAMDDLIRRFGHLDVVVSTPFDPLPLKPLAATDDWRGVLNEKDFEQLVETHITHHFRVAKKAALQDKSQIVLVTPKTSRNSSREEFALALFVKTTLHALTATLAVECERFTHHPTVNQVDLTRRARVEEPRNEREEREELARFVDAVLLAAAPAPEPEQSRYLSRIHRGNAMTV